MLTWPAGEYAVLEGDCCGETGVYESVLSAWIEGMGLISAFAPSGRAGCAGPFAVYEAGKSFRRQDTRVKIYQKI